MNNNNADLKCCIEKIEQWFRYDTISLLDCVLTDDENDPDYSAVTVYSRLEQVVKFQELYCDIKYKDVFDYLSQSNYSSEDVERFKQRILEENK